MSFPRSYDVLYWLAQGCTIGVGVVFGGLGVFGVAVSPWWLLVLLPHWGLFVAWRLVARAHFRRNERELEELWGKLAAERDRLLALRARMEGREQ